MIVPPLDPAHGRRALPGRAASLRRGERGGISWITALLLAAIASGAYLVWVWGPAYVENYEVKQVVHDYMNQAVKDRDDDGLRRRMVLKIRSLNERQVVDQWGRAVRVPAVELDEHDVAWERDTRSQPPMLRVAFEYVREVEYPWLNRSGSKVFVVDLTSDLTVPDWGPPR